MTPSRTLVFLLMEDWFFASHFWARGLAAKRAGWRVVLIARESEAARRIEASGIEFYPANLNRRRLNPFTELAVAWQLVRIYRELKPDLVHHIALKPIILGGLAARLAGVKTIINAPIGLGFVFSSSKPLARILRPLVRLALRATLPPKHGAVIFENPDDREVLVNAKLVPPEATLVIRGAGVDTGKFAPTPAPPGPVRIVLTARMIREKGIPDFVAAAHLLHGQAEFLLAGAPDAGNPDSLTEAELRGFEAEGVVRWLGPVSDVAALLAGVHIFCLPSTYREGLPKAVLEAMSSGTPVVATDIPGCREAVVDGETGFLVPPRAPEALASALARLIADPALRARMGAAGRRRVEENFSDAIICTATLKVYDSLVPARCQPNSLSSSLTSSDIMSR
jgi:glycosyltransferase involved in cell wall biosynthesis